jgi:hypothetical protein
MGLNIYPCIISRRDNNRIQIKSFDDFETQRYSGDRKFVMTHDFEWDNEIDNLHGRPFGEIGEVYSRPHNIEEAKIWVNKNIKPEGNKNRLLKLLDAMKENPKLFLYCSW